MLRLEAWLNHEDRNWKLCGGLGQFSQRLLNRQTAGGKLLGTAQLQCIASLKPRRRRR
jgi:hypothetical protein